MMITSALAPPAACSAPHTAAARRRCGPHSHRRRPRFSGQTRIRCEDRARYYHPSLQRFSSEDPIGFLGGDANLYAYARNAPLGYTDPRGLRLDLTEAGDLVAALQRVRQTKRGAEIFRTLDQLPETYRIVEGRGNEASRYDPYTRTIVVNINLPEHVCTTTGRKPGSPERKLAHEGGHALGYPGIGATKAQTELFEMNNIRRNENPVVTELGMPERTSYDSNRCR